MSLYRDEPDDQPSGAAAVWAFGCVVVLAFILGGVGLLLVWRG